MHVPSTLSIFAILGLAGCSGDKDPESPPPVDDTTESVARPDPPKFVTVIDVRGQFAWDNQGKTVVPATIAGQTYPSFWEITMFGPGGQNASQDDICLFSIDLLSFKGNEELAALKQQVADGENPRNIKFLLCEEIVERFHDRKAADSARETFIARFQGGAMPEEIPERTLDSGGAGIGIATALTQCGLTSSNSEAFRMVQQGGVRIDGEKVSDRNLQLEAGFEGVLQVGKRKFCKAHVE